MSLFPEDSAERKTYPVYSGLLQYFPSALAAVAHHSFTGNEKHNPGKPLHHDRAKSGDEADALVRHLMEADYVGMAWRALSMLQKHLEACGSPVAPAARNVQPSPPIAKHPYVKFMEDQCAAESLREQMTAAQDISPEPAEVLSERLESADYDQAAA